MIKESLKNNNINPVLKISTGKHETSEYMLTLSNIYFSFVLKEIQINYKNEDIPNGILLKCYKA